MTYSEPPVRLIDEAPMRNDKDSWGKLLRMNRNTCSYRSKSARLPFFSF